MITVPASLINGWLDNHVCALDIFFLPFPLELNEPV